MHGIVDKWSELLNSNVYSNIIAIIDDSYDVVDDVFQKSNKNSLKMTHNYVHMIYKLMTMF